MSIIFFNIFTDHSSYTRCMNDLRKIKRQNLLIYTTGYIAVTVLGTLLHFVYGWSSSNMLVGLFAAVNESTWEHMKLAFYPMLIFSVIFMVIYYKQPSRRGTLPVGCTAANLAESTLLATWLIPVMFYTYSGILGFNVAFIDIAIFFISVLFAFIHLWKLQNNDDCGCYGFLIIVVVQLIIFFVFTSKPPALGLFIPPLG